MTVNVGPGTDVIGTVTAVPNGDLPAEKYNITALTTVLVNGRPSTFQAAITAWQKDHAAGKTMWSSVLHTKVAGGKALVLSVAD